MGSIKVNGKPYSSSSPLSKRNAGERHEGRGREREEGRPEMQQDSAHWEPGKGRWEPTRNRWGEPYVIRQQSVFGHH